MDKYLFKENLDEEWVELIKSAYDMGLTEIEIRAFLEGYKRPE